MSWQSPLRTMEAGQQIELLSLITPTHSSAPHGKLGLRGVTKSRVLTLPSTTTTSRLLGQLPRKVLTSPNLVYHLPNKQHKELPV